MQCKRTVQNAQCCAKCLETSLWKRPNQPNRNKNKAQRSTEDRQSQQQQQSKSVHKQTTTTQAQPTSRAKRKRSGQTKYSKASAEAKQTDRQTRIQQKTEQIIPPPSPAHPSGRIANMHIAKYLGAVLLGTYGVAGGGGAHAPGWVSTIGQPTSPDGNHCIGGSGPTYWHATRISKY